MRRSIVAAVALVLAAGIGIMIAGRPERGPSLETVQEATTTTLVNATYPIDDGALSSTSSSSSSRTSASSTSTTRGVGTTTTTTRASAARPTTTRMLGNPGDDPPTAAAPNRPNDIILTMGRCTLVSSQWRCPGTATFRLSGGAATTIDWTVSGSLEYACVETESFERPQASFTVSSGQTSAEKDLVLSFPQAKQPNGIGDEVDASVASARAGNLISRPVDFVSDGGCTAPP